MTTMIDIVRLLKQKGYNCIWNGACNIEFLDNYNFHTIPKGFIFKDNNLIQVTDIKLKKEKQIKRDTKILEKWVKSL